MDVGPIQIVVIGLEDAVAMAELLPDLRRLRETDGPVRLLDLVLVFKDEEGYLTGLELGRPAAEPGEFGDLAATLVGLGQAGEQGISVGAGAGMAGSGLTQSWAVSDGIPPDSWAAVVLLEHRWAVSVRAAVARVAGFALEDTWVLPADLMAAGAVLPGRRA